MSAAREIENTPSQPDAASKNPGKFNRRLLGSVVLSLAVLLTGALVQFKIANKNNNVAEGGKPENSQFKVNRMSGALPLQTSTDPLPPTYKNCIAMEFVKVPKGTGWLGGGGGKPGETRVEFTADFYLGKYEVTQEEWEKLMDKNPSHFSRTGGDSRIKDVLDADLKRFPVESMSWDECQLFLNRLNKKEKITGWTYRLPKVAEWEYACRGGPMAEADKSISAFNYYFANPTNTALPQQGNFGDSREQCRTCKVGSYEPNALGLHDMHGNVAEWCDDIYETAYTKYFKGGGRLTMGGSWNYASHSQLCWAANSHSSTNEGSRSVSLGLRLARVPTSSEGK